MGFAACFGGPMLNILLGVGVSGALIVHQNGGAPYILDFSTPLRISSIALQAILLVSAVVVSLNGFHLTRRWGMCLIFCYLTVLTVNIVVELVARK
jgi:sodium/potassium/calcium exchanger 6